MSKQKNAKKIRNRALTSDRPDKIEKLRVYEPDKKDLCHPTQLGHDYRFYPFDRYGVCIRCNSEVLT